MRLGILILAFFSFTSSLFAATIYVDDDACPGPGTGTLPDPYCSIQTAINAAANTDLITVAPGTYFEKITRQRRQT